MQKFRFLLPLVILTLIVVAISYGVRQYANSKSSTSDVSSSVTSDGDASIPGNTNPEETPQEKGLLARIFGTKKVSTTQSSDQVTVTVTPKPSPIDTSFSQTEVEVPINQEREVFVTLDSDTNLPTAYTFNMHFDPSSIAVVKVEPGDIWQQTSVFTKGNKIDNVKGTLSFSAGQALGTQKGNGKTLIKISIKAKATKETGTELTIDDTSKFAYVGLDYAIPLRSKSIGIQVTK